MALSAKLTAKSKFATQACCTPFSWAGERTHFCHHACRLSAVYAGIRTDYLNIIMLCRTLFCTVFVKQFRVYDCQHRLRCCLRSDTDLFSVASVPIYAVVAITLVAAVAAAAGGRGMVGVVVAAAVADVLAFVVRLVLCRAWCWGCW